MLYEFELGYKYTEANSGRPKTVDSKIVHPAIETNLVSSTRRVSGELGISQSSVVPHILHLSKILWSCRIVRHG